MGGINVSNTIHSQNIFCSESSTIKTSFCKCCSQSQYDGQQLLQSNESFTLKLKTYIHYDQWMTISLVADLKSSITWWCCWCTKNVQTLLRRKNPQQVVMKPLLIGLSHKKSLFPWLVPLLSRNINVLQIVGYCTKHKSISFSFLPTAAKGSTAKWTTSQYKFIYCR